jgi:hypothetical protein
MAEEKEAVAYHFVAKDANGNVQASGNCLPNEVDQTRATYGEEFMVVEFQPLYTLPDALKPKQA